MDPITFIGLLASVVQIGDVVHKCIGILTGLKSAYRRIPLVVSTLIGQLYIVKTALDHLSLLYNSDKFNDYPRYHQLALQMNTALDSFGPLMLALQERLDKVNAEQEVLTLKKKTQFLWNENEMDYFLVLLDRQVNALNLLLQTIQCHTWADQQKMFDDDENQSVLQLARDCSSSIIGANSTRASMITEDTDGMSAEFDFDALLLSCRSYLAAHRSHLRQAVRSAHPGTWLDASRTDESESSHDDSSSDDSADQDETTTIRSITRSTIHSTDSQNFEFLDMADFEPPSLDLSSASIGRQVPSLSNLSLLATSLQSLRALPSPKVTITPPPVVASTDKNKTFALALRNAIRPRTRSNQAVHGNNEQPIRLPKPEVKALILGTSESGKSTLLKGMKLFTEGDYTNDQKKGWNEVIFSNLVQSFRCVLEAMEDFELPLNDVTAEYHAQTIFMQPPQIWDDHLPPEVAPAIEALWKDGAFQQAFSRGTREYQLNDSAGYYVQSIDRIRKADYIPSSEDVLRSRVKTTGITETTFDLNGTTLRLFDVGGTRSERKKWIHCFENVNVIYFLVDVTAYDRPLFEDETVNRMEEQFTLFDSIVNSRWFPKTDFILMFTKMDFLERYLQASHPAEHFEDFKPALEERTPTVDEYMTYLEDRFMDLINNPNHRESIQVMRVSLVDIGAWDLAAKETPGAPGPYVLIDEK